MGTTWSNNDGLVVQFGTRKSQGFRPGQVAGVSLNKELVIDFTYSNLDVGPVNNDGGILYIPAGGFIKSARLMIDNAFVGGTSLSIGTAQQDGTAIAATGIFNATELAVANLTIGAVKLASAGTQIGTVSSSSLNSYITITAVGTFTAGTARLVVEYLPKYDA